MNSARCALAALIPAGRMNRMNPHARIGVAVDIGESLSVRVSVWDFNLKLYGDTFFKSLA